MSFDIDMETYGRNSAPAAAEQTVDTNSYQQEGGEVAIHQELLDQPVKNQVDEVPEAPLNPQAENFRALREEVDRIKAEKEAEKREYQLQLDMLRANLNSQQAQKQPEVSNKQMFDGMKDDDVPSVAEIRREWQQREAEYQARLEELQVQQMHPDYAEVIEKFALPLVKQKPHLMQGIQNSSNKALMAYELGKMAQQINASSAPSNHAPPPRSDVAQRIVENSRKPGTLSGAGGQGALSKADYFATMSDQEFMRFASRNLEGI
jgi:hypothetical protein